MARQFEIFGQLKTVTYGHLNPERMQAAYGFAKQAMEEMADIDLEEFYTNSLIDESIKME